VGTAITGAVFAAPVRLTRKRWEVALNRAVNNAKLSLALAAAVMEKLVCVDPAGTVTAVGPVSAVLLVNNAILAPPAGAG